MNMIKQNQAYITLILLPTILVLMLFVKLNSASTVTTIKPVVATAEMPTSSSNQLSKAITFVTHTTIQEVEDALAYWQQLKQQQLSHQHEVKYSSETLERYIAYYEARLQQLKMVYVPQASSPVLPSEVMKKPVLQASMTLPLTMTQVFWWQSLLLLVIVLVTVHYAFYSIMRYTTKQIGINLNTQKVSQPEYLLDAQKDQAIFQMVCSSLRVQIAKQHITAKDTEVVQAIEKWFSSQGSRFGIDMTKINAEAYSSFQSKVLNTLINEKIIKRNDDENFEVVPLVLIA